MVNRKRENAYGGTMTLVRVELGGKVLTKWVTDYTPLSLINFNYTIICCLNIWKKSSLLYTSNDKKLSIKIIILFGRFCLTPLMFLITNLIFPVLSIYLNISFCWPVSWKFDYFSISKVFEIICDDVISCFYKLLKNNYFILLFCGIKSWQIISMPHIMIFTEN